MKRMYLTVMAITLVAVGLMNVRLVYADNVLNLPEGISLLAINGKTENVDNGLFKKQSRFSLAEGENQLLITVTSEIKNGSDIELETSDPAIITFTATQQTLTLAAPRILTESEMETFNRELNWTLTNSDGKNVVFKTALLPLKGFRLGIDYDEELKKFNRSKKPASIHSNPNFLPIDADDLTNTEQAVILKMLKHWYNIATPETQSRFWQELKNKEAR